MAGKADHYGSLTMFVNVCNVIVYIVGYLCGLPGTPHLQGSVSVSHRRSVVMR